MPHFEFFDPRFGDMKIVRRVPAQPVHIEKPPRDEGDTAPLDPLHDLVGVTHWHPADDDADFEQQWANQMIALRERMAERRAAYQPGLLWRAIAAFWRLVRRF